MDQVLITLARYSDPATAGLARSRLEAAGIPAFLADEATMGLAWHWNPAVGGIRLQIAPEHAEEARLLLDDPGKAVETWRDFPGDAPVPSATEEPEEDPEIGPRERLARRTVLAGVIGWVLTPLLLYSLVIGIRALAMGGALSGRQRTQLWLVTLLDVVLIGVWTRIFLNLSGS